MASNSPPLPRSRSPEMETANPQEWRKPQRPAYHPEEGQSDRSDWASLIKATFLILLPVAVLAFILTS